MSLDDKSSKHAINLILLPTPYTGTYNWMLHQMNFHLNFSVSKLFLRSEVYIGKDLLVMHSL